MLDQVELYYDSPQFRVTYHKEAEPVGNFYCVHSHKHDCFFTQGEAPVKSEAALTILMNEYLREKEELTQLLRSKL